MATIRNAITGESGHLSAPTINTYIHALDRNALTADTEARNLIGQLFHVLDSVKACGDDNRKELWISTARGPIEDYGDFEEMKADGDVEDYEEFQRYWLEEYPEDIYWYHLVTVEHDGYSAVILRNRLVLEVHPQMEGDNALGAYLYPFLHWLIAACTQCVQALQEGTYNANVQKHLPWKHRTGTILRNDYWAEYPEEKAAYLKDFPKDDMAEFISLMDGFENEPPVMGKMHRMTSGLFFQCCALGYAANHYDGSQLKPKDQYIRHADGRDDGLLALTEDDAEAFDQWYNDRNRFGGHPWEVCRGGNSTHVDLYVVKDEDGYYFLVGGKAWNRSVEAANFFLALHRAGLPVTIREGRAMADRFLGIDKIGIVPEGVMPAYCESYFPQEHILDFMNLHADDEEKLIGHITWQSIPEAVLR